MQPHSDPLIRPWSVLGRYVRRCIITYEKMSFDKIVTLSRESASILKIIQMQNFPPSQNSMNVSISNFNDLHIAASNAFFNKDTEEPSLIDMDLDASINSINGDFDKNFKSKLYDMRSHMLANKAIPSNQVDALKHVTSSTYKVAQNVRITAPISSNFPSNKAEDSTKKLKFSTSANGCAFSRKIAEYFVAQQAYLIENNEFDSLSPVELQQKTDEILAHDSSYPDAYYLKYLNFLRIKDYTGALKCLHEYFDRLLISNSISLAALNLVSLEYRFGNK